MHNVHGVGDGIQYDARAAENTGALAHRTSHALLLAIERNGVSLPLAIYLPLALS
jgi:hypothetical protein